PARKRTDGRECPAALREGVPPLLLVAHDLHCARDAHPHAIEALPLLFDLGAINRNALDGELDGRDLVEQKIVALLSGATDSFRASRPHPEWWMRLLHRPRLDHDVTKIPVLALMREAPLRRPRLAQERHAFLEALGRLRLRDAEALEFGIAIALADAEIE